jgi:hypothetical protein
MGREGSCQGYSYESEGNEFEKAIHRYLQEDDPQSERDDWMIGNRLGIVAFL